MDRFDLKYQKRVEKTGSSDKEAILGLKMSNKSSKTKIHSAELSICKTSNRVRKHGNSNKNSWPEM